MQIFPCILKVIEFVSNFIKSSKIIKYFFLKPALSAFIQPFFKLLKKPKPSQFLAVKQIWSFRYFHQLSGFPDYNLQKPPPSTSPSFYTQNPGRERSRGELQHPHPLNLISAVTVIFMVSQRDPEGGERKTGAYITHVRYSFHRRQDFEFEISWYFLW